MNANKDIDQECSIRGNWYRAHTEWYERMQIVNKCPCEELSFVRKKGVVGGVKVMVIQGSGGKLEI